MTRPLAALMIGVLLMLAGCSYADFARPRVRNYAGDLFYRSTRPPDEAMTAEERLQKLAEAVARWSETAAAEPESYVVGPGDVLRISLLVPTRLDASVLMELRVSEGGVINCPLLGDVAVAGLSTPAIEAKLRELYGEGYYRNPMVVVLVSEYASKQVFIGGAVAKPGVLSLRANRVSLLEALLEAGGLTEDAGDSAVVTRATRSGEDEGPVPATVRVDLRALVERLDIARNIWLEPGDVVYVPESEPGHFYVFGFVRAPGVYEMPARGGLGVMDAIGYARGLSEEARPRNTYLLRETAEGEEVFRVDLTRVAAAKEPDVPLRANDTIIVGTSWTVRVVNAVLHSTGLKSLMPAGAY